MRDANRATRQRWLSEQQMRDAMNPPTIEEIFAYGEFARTEARKADHSDWWVDLTIAMLVGVILGTLL